MMRIFLIIISLFYFNSVSGQLWVRNRYSPDELVRERFVKDNSGVKILKVDYRGSRHSIAYFLNKTPAFNIANGLILSTGFAQSVAGNNLKGNTGAPMGHPGDRDLSQLVQARTNDAAVLIIEFVSYADSIEFSYFFGSEEYPEYVNKGVNDVFAFFIRKVGDIEYKNIAQLPDGTPVTVDNINKKKNKEYYIPNGYFYGYDPDDPAADQAKTFRTMEFTFDGFTTMLNAAARVEPFKPYELKIAIADVGDDLYDSGVFLEQGSFKAPMFQKMPIHDIEYKLHEMNDKFDKQIAMQVDNDTLKITSRIEYEFNTYAVSEGYHSFLDAMALLVKDIEDIVLRIDGHTDAVGSFNYNMDLSQKRALAIADYLVGKGVARNRMLCVGYGSSKPVASDSTETGRAQNRRVEFKINQTVKKK